MVQNSGINGVQLFPELTEIVLLMFADDFVDTVQGVQCLLNLLYDFCTNKGLIINIIKTMIVVFKKVACCREMNVGLWVVKGFEW